MKAAFSIWHNRIAPVFDVARRVLVVEKVATGELCHRSVQLVDNLPSGRVLQLAEMQVPLLVCGAISTPLQQLIKAYGIEIMPFLAGDTQKVISAWQGGRLELDAFTMPGCRHHRHRYCRNRSPA